MSRSLLILALLGGCPGSNDNVLTENDASTSSDSGDGSTQSRPWLPESSGTTTTLYSVWASDPTNVFAVGGAPGTTAGNPGVIVRGDGTSWSVTSHLINLFATYARTSVGEYGGEGSATYWNGSTWSPRGVLAAGNLRGTWETTPGTYAVGDTGSLLYTSETGVAGSYDRLTTNTTNALYGVWGSSSSDVYVVGAGGTILHNTNAGVGGTGTWVKTTHGSSTLRAVWGSSANDVYIVGEAPAVILHSTDGGTTWTSATLPASALGLYGIHGRSANDVYVVGATGGLVFHSTGNDVWTTEPLPSTHDMFDVWVTGTGDAYAVGRDGKIAHKAPSN